MFGPLRLRTLKPAPRLRLQRSLVVEVYAVIRAEGFLGMISLLSLLLVGSGPTDAARAGCSQDACFYVAASMIQAPPHDTGVTAGLGQDDGTFEGGHDVFRQRAGIN